MYRSTSAPPVLASPAPPASPAFPRTKEHRCPSVSMSAMVRLATPFSRSTFKTTFPSLVSTHLATVESRAYSSTSASPTPSNETAKPFPSIGRSKLPLLNIRITVAPCSGFLPLRPRAGTITVVSAVIGGTTP